MSFLCSCQKPLELRIKISTPVPPCCMLQAGLFLENGLIRGSQGSWHPVPDSGQQWVCRGRGKGRVSRLWGQLQPLAAAGSTLQPGMERLFFFSFYKFLKRVGSRDQALITHSIL